MNYKDIFYSKYVSTHTSKIYQKVSLEDLRKNYIFYDSYFGNFLPKFKDAKILDLGCGNGSLVKWLLDKGFGATTGIDVSQEQISQGVEMGISGIRVEDFKDFFKNNKEAYDVIFSIDVLEHMEKLEILNFLENALKALKPGGIFVAQTVNAENLIWGRLRHADFTHDIAFTSLSARQLFLVLGFEEIEIFPQRPVVHGVKSFIRYVGWRAIEGILGVYLKIETGSSKNSIFTQNIIIKAKSPNK